LSATATLVGVSTIVTAKLLADALKASAWYLGYFENFQKSTATRQIKKARLFHGLSQVQFAQSLDVSERIIHDRETDRYQPSKKYSAVLKKYLPILNNKST
jgi:DNA-binding XRE family transcriptional regulator